MDPSGLVINASHVIGWIVTLTLGVPSPCHVSGQMSGLFLFLVIILLFTLKLKSVRINYQ